MREPTPDERLYLWWAMALRDPTLARHEAEPQCGYYKHKMVKNGPWVPVELYCRRTIEGGALVSDEEIVAVMDDGTERDAVDVWQYLTPITRREWKARMASVNNLATHAPVDLLENPARPS